MLTDLYENLPEEERKEVRFKVPELVVFHEGNKTIIKNFSSAVESIRRNKQQVAKFMSRELASPVFIDGDRAIVQRKVMASLVNKKFKEFVNEYVICPICKRPDTNIVEEAGVKVMICEACGAKNPVRL